MAFQLLRPIQTVCMIVVMACASPAGPLSAQERFTVLKGHTGRVNSTTFNAEGTILATGGYDGTVILWNTTTGDRIKTLSGHRGYVYSIAFSPSGRMLAVGAGDPGSQEIDVTLIPPKVGSRSIPPEGEIKFWDVATGKEKDRIAVTNDVPVIISYKRDGKSLTSGGMVNANVTQWDLASRRGHQSQKGPGGLESTIAFAGDAQSLAWGTSSGKVTVLVPDKEKTWSGQHAPTVLCVEFSPDGKTLASGGINLKLWNVETGRELAFLQGHRAGVFALAFSSNGEILASGSGLWKSGKFLAGDVRLWDVKTHKQLALLEGHKSIVTAVAFTPDGRVLASGSEDGTVILWRMTAQGIEQPRRPK